MALQSENFRGDGFVIENCIIRGDEKHYDATENSLGEIIFNSFCETPNHIWQIEAETEKIKSFAEIKEKSTRLAVWLRKEVVGPDDVVSLCSSRHPEAESIFCATAFVGAAYSPMDYQVRDSMIYRNDIKAMKPKVIFAHESKLDVLQEAAELEDHAWKIILLDGDNSSEHQSLDDVLKSISLEEVENFQVTEVDPEEICVIFSSSGTTGMPKFIPLSHKKFIHQALQFNVHVQSDSLNDVVLAYFFPGWILHMLTSTRAILVRQTLIFHKDFEPNETCKIIEKYKVDTLIWNIHLTSLLSESDVMNKYDVSSVRCVHSVGARLFDGVRGKLLQIFPNAIFIGRGLGILEVGLVTLFNGNCRNPRSEGTVVPNVQLKIVDSQTGEALGPNEIGELCVKSPCMMTGYLNNMIDTTDAFDAEGWYRPGDEVYYDENGEIVVVGRSREIIKYREAELQPLLIEQTILAHPNIVDAAVVGIFDQIEIEQPVAFVRTAEGSKVTEEDILKLTSDLEYSDIFKDRVIFTDHIPRNSNGKIDRRFLRKSAENMYKSLSYNGDEFFS